MTNTTLVESSKERNEIMTQDSPENHLKEKIESEEMLLKAKVLEARSQAAKEIQNAKQDSDKTYLKKLREIKKKKEENIVSLEAKFKKYVIDTEKIEERSFQEITKKYEQKEGEVIKKLLERILP